MPIDKLPLETAKRTPTPTPPTPPPGPPDPPPEAPRLALDVTGKTPVLMGLAPRTLEEAWRCAQMFAKSELVPKNFRGHPEDILVAIEMGHEVGLLPMQALQSIAVINGRPSIWGDGFLALIVGSPLYQDHDEYFEIEGRRYADIPAADLAKDDTCAVCTFWRREKPIPVTRRFSIAAAKKAGLLAKPGPWQWYPQRMLSMRARSWAGRDAFPDLLRGIRTVEEALDEQEPTQALRDERILDGF